MIIFSTANGIKQTEASLKDVMYTLGSNFEVVYGVYEGINEVSFMTTNVKQGIELAKKYKQDTYLERGHRGIWYVIDTLTGAAIEAYKYLTEVPKDEAIASKNYSIYNNKYYILQENIF